MIHLTDADIRQVLPLVAKGLETYSRLQSSLATTDVAADREFQTMFNRFYRVRRNAEWRSAFYALFQLEKSMRRTFGDVLGALHGSTGRVEASFASKLVASVNPDMPVIDAFVLKNLGLRLPRPGPAADRLVRVVELHSRIRGIYDEYLRTDAGHDLVARFERTYPDKAVTRTKMLDFVLWQARRERDTT